MVHIPRRLARPFVEDQGCLKLPQQDWRRSDVGTRATRSTTVVRAATTCSRGEFGWHSAGSK